MEPMVTTVPLNYVWRIPASFLKLSLHFLCRFALSPGLVYPSGYLPCRTQFSTSSNSPIVPQLSNVRL